MLGCKCKLTECRRDAMVGKEQWRTPLLSVGLYRSLTAVFYCYYALLKAFSSIFFFLVLEEDIWLIVTVTFCHLKKKKKRD